MSKIYGIVSLNKNSNIAENFENLIKKRKEGYLTVDQTWQSRQAYLGKTDHKNSLDQPIFIKDDQITLFCGQLFDYHDKAKKTSYRAEDPYIWSDCGFFHHLLREEGTKNLSSLNGVFTSAIWNTLTKKLILINDRLGLRPLYYTYNISKKLLVFSSDLDDILASGVVDMCINWSACSCFLYFGHHLGTDTFFKDVYALPPASVLTFNKDGQVRIETYWDPKEVSVNENISYDEAIEGAGELFAQAIRRRLDICKNKQAMVLLSGGQDSRHIAAELSRHICIKTYTTHGFNLYTANEKLAPNVAKKLGVENSYIKLPSKGFLTNYWPRAHYLMDYEADLHQWILPLIDALPEEPWINFDGILGDVCQASVFLSEEYMRLSQDRNDIGLAEKAAGSEPNLKILHPSIRKHLGREVVIDKARQEFQHYAGHPYQVNYAFLRNRTRRAISLFAFKLVILKAESIFPFADNDFFEFTMSLPPSFKMDRKFHRRVLDVFYPELRDVPTTKEINLQEYKSDEFGYRRQKRHYIRWCIRERAIRDGWLFDKRTLLPKIVLDLVSSHLGRDRAYFFCNPSFAVFCDWITKYFPHGPN